MPNQTLFSPPEGSTLPSSIVGTLSTREGFDALAANPGPLPCDWVEFRGDQLPVEPGQIFSLSSRLQARGVKSIYTLRLRSEGGAVDADDELRCKALNKALDQVSAVDIEVASPFAAEVVQAAADAGKGVILSSHHFSATPEVNRTLATFAPHIGDHILVKVAGMLETEGDLWTLVDVLRALSDRPACVMGMGPLGARSRIVLAGLGSRFTYGYLDCSAAPGQMSCEVLRAIFQGDR